ncbi:hypothetical protein [Deinococcus sp. RM]|uniref:hypothetical protein n=1 Tax=Deinococcus sp. RM TaxID=2316359 RepID=UPI00131416D7|nr:hypothetical protein [Deinococcus sp. RM]
MGLTLLPVMQVPLLAVLGGSRGRVLVLTVGGLGFLWAAGVAAPMEAEPALRVDGEPET